MFRFRRWILFLLCWLPLAVPRAAEPPQWLADTGSPPPQGVNDRAGLFSRDPAALQGITEMIARLKADHDFQLYLVVDSVLISGRAPMMAARMQEAWLPDGDGLVVVYEVDTRSLGIGRGIGEGVDASPGGKVPSYEMVDLLSGLHRGLDFSQEADVFVKSLMMGLGEALNGYFERRNAPSSPGRSLRVGLITVGTLSILALAGLGVGWVLQRSTTEGSRRFLFPEVDLPERLEAPSGGGSVTSRRFDQGGGNGNP